MSYMQFRRELDGALLKCMDADMVRRVGSIVDRVARSYTIEPACTALTEDVLKMPAELNWYLAACRLEGMSDATIKIKSYALRAFVAYVRKPIRAITTNDIRGFLYDYQDKRRISDRSLDGVRLRISAFFTWLVDNDYADKNVCHPIKKIRYEIKQREHLTQLELEELRAACRTERERAFVEFLYSTGCRISEAAQVKMCDIDFAACEVSLYGKGKKHRTSYLNAKSILAIRAYLKTLTYAPVYLFSSTRAPHGAMSKAGLERIMRTIEARRETGGKRVTPHVIRHTTATSALKAGMPITQIQRLLGHASVATTQIYAETNQDDVRRSHERCVV